MRLNVSSDSNDLSSTTPIDNAYAAILSFSFSQPDSCVTDGYARITLPACVEDDLGDMKQEQ